MDPSLFFSFCVAAITFVTLLSTIIFSFNRESKVHQENKTLDSSSSSSSSSLSLTSSTSSSLSRNWKHHVFPSFHGADVRKAFLTHILKEFKRKGIDPFLDKDIEKSKSIGPELIESIRGSKIAVVLLSRNYASSTWCMNELVEIMRCREELGQTVMTIFYEVDPTDVKKQTGEFGKVFRKTCKGKTNDEIKRWKNALEGVATIAGEHSRNWNNEAAMIEKIATDVSNMLNNSTPSSDFNGLVGMGAHMYNMGSLLRLDLDEVRMIGIWGPSGIGKTTIARFLFNQVSSSFQLSTIMVNIKGSYPRPCLDEYSAQLQLQSQMLSQMINHKDIMIPHLGVAQERLRNKKVFLVLDDVDHLGQLNALAREVQWFGPGSRIIITTEDVRVLKAHGINHIYQVNFPTDYEAFQILCMNAFGQSSPKAGFVELAREVMYLAGKLPLGLKVIGSYFRGMSKEEWTRALPKLRNRLDGEIESILKFSYDALCDDEKDLFLHIACFFNYKESTKVKEYLSSSFLDVSQGFDVLVEKSLISIENGLIVMHKLLIQLGREIVRKQSVREPGRRQFLVHSRDICELFSDDETTSSKSIIGIDFDLTQINDELSISERAFEGMSNLQFLRFDYARVHRNSNNLYFLHGLNYQFRKLRLLEWPCFPMTCLPSIVNTKFLVELNMPESKLEKMWEGIQPLSNLKWMDLSSSRKLKELPDLSTATKLHELNLRECSSLVEIPSSIGNATSLVLLDLFSCSSLVKVPSSIGNCHDLERLNLICCSSLVELPSSIGNLHRLPILNLCGCSKLEVLPTNINMESLTELILKNCSLIKVFPEISTNIEYLYLVGNAVKEVPSSVESWPYLKELLMSYSESLVEFPHALDIITELHLTDTEIEELGPWVKGCSRLHRLVLRGCKKLISLPELPASLSVIDAGNCDSLERLDCYFHNPRICLDFVNCFKLDQDARDLIIQTSTSDVAVLPGGEVPAYFTYRASGSSIAVKLDEKPLHTSTKFKACIMLVNKGETEVDYGEGAFLHSSIKSTPDALTTCTSHGRNLYPILTDHLYAFEVKAGEVTSPELVFTFTLHPETITDAWEIKECGIVQLVDSLQVDEHYENFKSGDKDYESSETNTETEIDREVSGESQCRDEKEQARSQEVVREDSGM